VQPIMKAQLQVLVLRCHPNGTGLPFSFQNPYQECPIRFFKNLTIVV
jgi:hypothetical protein